MNIVQIGAAVLRAPAEAVARDEIGTPEFQSLVETMIDVMRNAPGVGLAAPQIGVNKRLIVLEDREAFASNLSDEEKKERGRIPFDVRVIVNPELQLLGEKKATFFEGCLSVAGFVALVERSHEVEVSGLDEHGAPVLWKTVGWPARILQHECDHVNGTVYIDRMITRSFSTQDEARTRFAGMSFEEIRAAIGV